MITDLFATISGFDVETPARVVPPSCRREASSAHVAKAEGAHAVLEFPEWRPRRAARQLLPSLAIVTELPYSLRFEVSTWSAGEWSPWVASATLGDADFGALPDANGALACDVDVYTASASADAVRLRTLLRAADCRALLACPWIATLSACDLASAPIDASTGSVSASPMLAASSVSPLPVPALTQMTAPADIAPRICSPTSVAMVLGYWGRPVPPVAFAAEVFHAPTDRYGVWPAAIRAAARHGVAGYLLRFPDWAAAAWCLHRGLPIVASVRYGPDTLTGAAIPESTGHLVVLTGCDEDTVFVNDPAALTTETVPRRYRRDEFCRAWLDGTGVGYVLFPPDSPLAQL